MDLNQIVQLIAVLALPLLFAITVHEAAHGWVANRLGDHTAFMLGRVTFNPIKHIDPVGTVVVPLTILLLSSLGGMTFMFGWAKPVPVDWRNLRHPRRDMALVAIAGPGVNLAMALLWGLMIKLGIVLLDVSEWVAMPMIYMGSAGVLINLVLMTLNLFPLLPLDGGRVFESLLPPRLAYAFSRLEPFGLIILLALLFTGILGKLLTPAISLSLMLIPGSHVVRELFPL
jgi:Zn-dependent protease